MQDYCVILVSALLLESDALLVSEMKESSIKYLCFTMTTL